MTKQRESLKNKKPKSNGSEKDRNTQVQLSHSAIKTHDPFYYVKAMFRGKRRVQASKQRFIKPFD